MIRSLRWLNPFLWLLALALVGTSVMQLPFDDMLSRLGRLSLADYLMWIALNAYFLYLLVKRWQLLSAALGTQISLSELFQLRQSGSTVSFITPGPHLGGEPFQVYWLQRRCQLSLSRAIAVLGLDRFMETSTNLAVLLSCLFILIGGQTLPGDQTTAIIASLALALALLVGGGVTLATRPQWFSIGLRAVTRRWIKLDRWVDDEWLVRSERGWRAMIQTLRSALDQQRPRLWLALLLSLLAWGALFLELFLLLRWLGLAASAQELVLVMVAMRLAMLLPVPGGIGTVEAAVIWSFGMMGLPLSAAAGLLALLRLRDALMLLIGFMCLTNLQRPVGSTGWTSAAQPKRWR